ncbi:MAG: OadG family protein [Lachnospiraceae bacterium]|nr:OadG family protein [Lachnospiraceae bacterium]
MGIILSAGEAASFAERMEKAGLNTLLGMGMAFFVLIIIMFVIMLFPILFGERKPKKDARAELAEKAIENTISQIEEHEALTDDTELIAVIAAAIAAAEGSGSTEGIVIRSIRQRKLKKQWQRA